MTGRTIAVVANVAVWTVLLVWVFSRQIRVRPMSNRLTLPLIMIVAGAANLSRTFAAPAAVGLLSPGSAVVDLVVLLVSAILGAARGLTVKVWKDGERTLRQGTWLTILLWFVSIAFRLLVDFGGFVGNASHQPSGSELSFVLVYLGVTLLTQQLVVAHRARLID